MTTVHSDLLQEISSYAKRAGIAPSTLGRLAVNDGKLVSRLEAGGRVWPETAEKVRAFMRDNPPSSEAA